MTGSEPLNNLETNAGCTCGHVTFNLLGQSVFRAFCHCTICQKFNNAAYADVSVFRLKDVVKPPAEAVEFSAHTFPPILQRGKCKKCGSAAIEYLQIPAAPKLILVPTRNIIDQSMISKPAMHIFYDRKIADVEDDLPKHSGYLKSQLAFTSKLIASLLK